MTTFEHTIAVLFPDGVEYKALGEICKKTANIAWDSKKNRKFEYIDLTSVDRVSHVIEKTELIDAQTAPSRAQKIVRAKDVIFGTTRPTLKRYCFIPEQYDGQICSTGFCVLRANRDVVLPRYVFHHIGSERFLLHVEAKQRGSAYPAISDNEVKNYTIPIPPLPIQQEIVRILDTFTALEAELEAELEKRKVQYEYYRTLLLGGRVVLKSLKDISLSSRSGGTPLKSNSDYYKNGTIPWLRTQEVIFNEIYGTDCFITELAVQETSAKWVPANCVIVAISGASAGRCAINKIPLTTNQHCLCIEINPSIALYKYVFYCICSQYEELISKKEGARGDLNSSRILRLNIPIPSLEEQERIVAILDRFDALVNDIAQGLPAEIAARRKQYEYYRDKLLTFKRKETAV